MRAFWCIACGALLAVAAAGCKTTAKPNWFNPGTAPEQKAKAVLYDPFPENNAAPPIQGGRPRDYDRPLTEEQRTLLLQRQCPPPGARP